MAGAQGGTDGDYGASPADSRKDAGSRKAGAAPGRDRMKLLAERFRQKGRDQDGMTASVGVITEAAGLSIEEFEPLMTLLAEDGADQMTVRLLIVRWAALDPKAALAFALSQPGQKGDADLISCIVPELARKDLPAAMEAARRMDGRLRQYAGKMIARMIGEKNAKAALAYARELKDEDAEAGVLWGMAENDPMSAAAELVPGRKRNLWVVDKIATKLLARDQAAFETWTESLSDPAEHAVARCAVLTAKAGMDPAKAARETAAWLAENPEASQWSGDLSRLIVGKWLDGKAPPAAVAEWAASLPQGPAWNAAVSLAGQSWVEQDIVAASAWLDSLPQREGRDSVVESLVERIASENPESAFAWARTLGNPSMRYETLMTTLSGWAEKDSAAAQAAVETLPAGDRGYLLEFLREREKAAAMERK
ncbi:MAG: hypothetical protein JWM59_2932 [Verrucomicrobiales bacterium]|nr:hypothetical protein [Verrucomicrobiales bacterium]